MNLTDEELCKVFGGLTNNEIVNKINTSFPQMSEEIKEVIIETLNTVGKKGAKEMASKLIKDKFDWSKDFMKLFD